MSADQGRSVISKPILVIFVVVVLAGAAYYAMTMMKPDENNIAGVPKVPDNITPVSAAEMAKGPQPMGYGGGK